MGKIERSLKRACNELQSEPLSKLKLAKIYVLGFLEDIWFNCAKRPLRRIYIVYKYAKQGWNTHNWDYVFLLDDMSFKLRLMSEYIHKHGKLENKKEVVRQMLKFKVMLDNLQNIDQFIGSKYDQILEEKYGPYIGLVRNLEDALASVGIDRVEVEKNPKLRKEYNKEFLKYMDLEYEESVEYERRAMKYFLKHFRNWWD